MCIRDSSYACLPSNTHSVVTITCSISTTVCVLHGPRSAICSTDCRSKIRCANCLSTGSRITGGTSMVGWVQVCNHLRTDHTRASSWLSLIECRWLERPTTVVVALVMTHIRHVKDMELMLLWNTTSGLARRRMHGLQGVCGCEGRTL